MKVYQVQEFHNDFMSITLGKVFKQKETAVQHIKQQYKLNEYEAQTLKATNSIKIDRNVTVAITEAELS